MTCKNKFTIFISILAAPIVILMKTPSDELYNLIKSLSGPEKRAFKLFSRHNSGKAAYLQLFDAIDSLKRYDEKKLLLILDKTGGLRHLKQVKSYLHESIFRFMEHHHFDYSIEIELQKALQRAELLYDKGLLPTAKKCIDKAGTMAIENHQYLYLLNILSWKRKIMLKQADFEALGEDQNYLNEFRCIDLYKNLLEYQKIYDRVLFFLITGEAGDVDKKGRAELNDILQNPFLQNETKALSLAAKVVYFRILGDVHLLLKNWKESYAFFSVLWGYFEKARLTPVIRLLVLNRLVVALLVLKKNDEMLLVKNAAVKFFNSVPKKSQTDSLHAQYISLMINYAAHHLTELNTGEALSASDEIQKLVEKQASIQNFLPYYGNRAILSFVLTDYRKTLYYCNKALSVEKKGIRQDAISHIKIFSLIVHYELGNEDILPHLCKSYSRYFEKQSQQNKAENILLIFFGKTIHKNTFRQDSIKKFSALKKELEQCKKENIIDFFDFISWAESKIENRPMIAILKEKSLKVWKV